MLDFFKDSPAYEWMTRDAREEGREEVREEMRQREQRVLEKSRQIIVSLVSERFPKLARLAEKQVQKTENLETLQDAILFICATQDAIEVANILANLDEE